jgi:predicted negative regulator of RcsB-dependent stress response
VVQKRLTKRQMKEDPLLTWTVRIETYLEQNLKLIAIIVGAVALAIALVFVWRGARRGAESSASELLAQAQFQLWSGSPAQAVEIAKQVVERHSGTKSGRMARLVLGDALLQTGDAEGAITEYQSFLERTGGDPTMRLVARRGLAVAMENAKKYAEAAPIYEELAREGEGALAMRKEGPERMGMSKPEVGIIYDLMAAARCQALAGDAPKDTALYQEIADKYSAEPQAADAKLHLAELTARAAAAP